MSPTTTADPAAAPARRLLTELEHPRQVFANITPNWFASVMGTGIVANAAATLPLQFVGLRAGATIVWGLASILLVALIAATIVHWVTNTGRALSHHRDPVMAHFYGAPPMALLTVGAGTVLLGKDVLGLPLAVRIDSVLWTTGTVLGVISAVAIPYLTFTRHDLKPDAAFGGWLMPIVPPMVSAATGALLIPFLPAGQPRLTMLIGCYALFGFSLVASLIVITQLWSRLAHHKVGPSGMVPTLWIVLGPLGQSITAVTLLGGAAHLAVGASLARTLGDFGIVYGIPVLGFALLWGALAIAITIRTARAGLPFSLTWWSFTFPVGTCVTGVSGLALHTGAVALAAFAAVLYTGLLVAWAIVAVRTFHGSVIRGTLFALPRPAA